MMFLLAACARDLVPTWGFDPVWLEPAGEDDVHGFHTWQIYDERWSRKPDDRFYVCAVVAEFSGVPTASCGEACTHAWSVQSAVLESDCPASLAEDPLFGSLVGIGLGAASTSPDVPHPGATTVGWIDYGFGWEVHGDAWPEILDAGGTPETTEWDATQAFTFWPTALWPIGEATPATTAPVSRSDGPPAGRR
jgi:hypothetical protein